MRQNRTVRGAGATKHGWLPAVAVCATCVVVLALGLVAAAANPAHHLAHALPHSAATSSAATTIPASPSTPKATTPTTTKPAKPRTTASGTTTAVQQRAVATARAADASSSLLRAEAVVRSMKYTPVANDWYPDSVPGPLLEAIEAVPAGTVIGNQGHRVFFFVSGTYIGTDTNDGSANLEFAYSTGLVVAVNYDLYHPSDPLCCPSAGAKTVRFEWDGHQLHVLDAIPSPDPNTDPTRN